MDLSTHTDTHTHRNVQENVSRDEEITRCKSAIISSDFRDITTHRVGTWKVTLDLECFKVSSNVTQKNRGHAKKILIFVQETWRTERRQLKHGKERAREV